MQLGGGIMKVICSNTKRDYYKVSTAKGNFYEFINKECEVTDKDDLAYFSNHKGYKVEKKKGGK